VEFDPDGSRLFSEIQCGNGKIMPGCREYIYVPVVVAESSISGEVRRDGDGKLRWEYAHARMTAEPVLVRLDGVEVWSEPASGPNSTAPGNWICYFLDRDCE